MPDEDEPTGSADAEAEPQSETPEDSSEPSEAKSEGSALRSVGEALGGWARRVGVFVAETAGRPVIGEDIREPLAFARALRLDGDHQPALVRLRALLQEHPKEPFVRFAMALCHLHDLLYGGRPLRGLGEQHEALGEELGRGPHQLIAAALELYGGKPDRALDALRRARVDLVRMPEPVESESLWLSHVFAGLAHLELGNEERALRELQKARTRTPTSAGIKPRRLILSYGVELGLSSGELADAEAWVREALVEEPDDRDATALMCRVLAAKGDTIGAHALLERFDYEPGEDEIFAWVGLCVGLPRGAHPLLKIAMRMLQRDPTAIKARRVWALAELRRGLEEASPPSAGSTAEILSALADAAKAMPKASRDRGLQELAHAALRLDAIDETAVAPVAQRLRSDAETAPEELRLLAARHRLKQGEPVGDDLIGSTPPRFRADPDIGGPWGPDPQSPVRNSDTRASVLASQRKLVAAEACLGTGVRDLAQDLLVGALIDWPENRRARTLLGEATLDLESDERPRLEEVLTASTKVLAAVPSRVLGVSLEGVEQALAKVVAARERLARPLTIAIMGEFSAGKSTFVNALLGEAVAPMGVLPTTTTINVFRRGTAGGARVHYRDGRIGMIDAGEVEKFLHGLDDAEAERIRHVEIERSGERMGDAAVVDTPGLNALDEFHEQVAREFLDEADAVVWVFSATRSGAASEMSMLAELRDGGRQVLGVLNKVDTLDAGEQSELAEYLREQLGEVLVEVIPLRGREALEYRTEGAPQGEDPFSAVERALEEHFLLKARELKRSLTARRLDEALGIARDAATTAVAELETQADDATERARQDRPSAPILLQEFCDALEPRLLDADDVLTREALALGILETKKGKAKGDLDPLDAQYLAGCVRDAILAGLQRTLADIAKRDPAASEVLDKIFVPWARGHLDGLFAGRFIDESIEAHGPKIAEGEGPATAGFRAALGPIARTWSSHIKGLVPQVQRARHRADRDASSAPRAEALRLRAAVITTIDGLRETARAL